MDSLIVKVSSIWDLFKGLSLDKRGLLGMVVQGEGDLGRRDFFDLFSDQRVKNYRTDNIRIERLSLLSRLSQL